ncbi:MAG: aldo/keto reductase, partial [Alkalibacterium thalassium]|nr:aldo/keto reductase [Alkalibacterium thalassium]
IINDPSNYSEELVRSYLENSLRRLNREQIDLYQIHCAPLDMLKNTDLFPILDKLSTFYWDNVHDHIRGAY